MDPLAEKSLNIPGISTKCFESLIYFYSIILKLDETASKATHYEKLDEWHHIIYEHLHKLLDLFGFKNGEPEENRKSVDITFLCQIYSIVGDIIYSPFLETHTERHHSSAFERNQALKSEIRYIIENYYLNRMKNES